MATQSKNKKALIYSGQFIIYTQIDQKTGKPVKKVFVEESEKTSVEQLKILRQELEQAGQILPDENVLAIGWFDYYTAKRGCLYSFLKPKNGQERVLTHDNEKTAKFGRDIEKALIVKYGDQNRFVFPNLIRDTKKDIARAPKVLRFTPTLLKQQRRKFRDLIKSFRSKKFV
ncbi:MAG: hypothetical protein LBU87_04685 [Lactobacillales bacterium]|jgi:hypothetical protein|nr:hypothetical protein [Lactobacillales bacterium]